MGKLAVVTGGSKGIGKAIILKLAANGFDIITCARTKGPLDELKQEVAVTNPSCKFSYQQVDMSDSDQVKHFGVFVKDHNRPVGLLVNNAGIFRPGQIHQEEEGALEMQINTNLYSAYHLTRALIDSVKEAKGYIFNMCSTASITAYTNGGSYCISKFAMYGMTKVLREEMKEHQVRVSAIMPGATFTASWEGVDLPPERFMKPEDVAEAVWSAYSMSPQSVVEEILIRPQMGDL